jgi:hypothetical protein
MRYEEDGQVIAFEREEIEMVLRHLKQFEHLVKEFELRERQGLLSDGWDKHWAELKEFLQSEELEGSEVADAVMADGRYCCQWRSRGLASGQTECNQYDAWYIFAWLGCVGGAIWSSADATLQAGECSDMFGCP